MTNQNIHVWLDDIRPMPSNFTHHAKTAKEAIDLIDTGTVSTISLDHDLGPETAGTGYLVAKHIENLAYYNRIPAIQVMLHSSNPVGIQNMQMAIRNAELYWANHQANDTVN